ncbi:hypothetical protein [Paraburkholderia sp. J63]|uniref:hypothetical protein n=1 Tax=Paraburkholderia sp. J63 TaxID=2805434 RepID=UPI002ABDFD41|nr:hypothetical protein [Paraburkholderia sp. J63]
MKKVLIAVSTLALIYFFITHRSDSKASSCVRSTSPDRLYIAEECRLDWNHRDNPEYVGRVYGAASGKLIARRTFSTPSPKIMWADNYVQFQIGGDDDDLVMLPPSLYDRINALYWRMTQW